MSRKKTQRFIIAGAVLVAAFALTACQNLSYSKLSANYHFNRANSFFRENQYRRAITEYIRNHRGDVYEPFCGSGSTVIAAERQGRRCYAMEIEPRYVAVSNKRWEQYTGRTAEKMP